MLLSQVRLGIVSGLLRGPDLSAVSRLMLLIQPGHLQQVVGKRLTQNQRRAARASLLRSRLKGPTAAEQHLMPAPNGGADEARKRAAPRGGGIQRNSHGRHARANAIQPPRPLLSSRSTHALKGCNPSMFYESLSAPSWALRPRHLMNVRRIRGGCRTIQTSTALAAGTAWGAHDYSEGDGCHRCESKRLPWERAVRLGPYEDLLRDAILETKFTRWRHVGEQLGRRLGESLCSTLAAKGQTPADAVLIPVPSSTRRRLVRGIDHTLAIARGMRRASGIEISRPLSARFGPHTGRHPVVKARPQRLRPFPPAPRRGAGKPNSNSRR